MNNKTGIITDIPRTFVQIPNESKIRNITFQDQHKQRLKQVLQNTNNRDQ